MSHPLAAVLAQNAMPLWVYLHLPSLIFVFGVGACVGSFLNVVVYRLPAGMSVIHPPSACPACGTKLKFFSENLPIIGWFLVRGKCRTCGIPVSPQYMVVELFVALLFAALYVLLFWVSPSTPWWGDIGGPWWSVNGLWRVWPTFFTLAFLLAALVAMTLIDAKTFTIPIEIPVVVTVMAFVAAGLQALLPTRAPTAMTWPIPAPCWPGSLAAAGGVLGVGIGIILLRTGIVKYSFADYDDYCEEGETLGDYPHARREMWREILFLLPCLGLGVLGWYVGQTLTGSPPVIVSAVGASFAGYLCGGGLIWGIRILGTFAFGREAMGLGDVHLLGAVGAVLGWVDPIFIFFAAPFSGLLWVLGSIGLSSVFKVSRRELPYGPHLAIATFAVVFLRPGLDLFQSQILAGVPIPGPGLCP